MNDKKLFKFGRDDYEITQSHLLYDGVFRLKRYHVKHRLFQGGWSGEFTREVFERLSASAILPYDPDTDSVILIEQFRPGAIQKSSPWLLEIVAGVYSEGEDPLAVAIRESLEEAGCKILDHEKICEFFVSPGGSNEYLHLYVGRIDASNADGIFGLPEENENIRAITVSSDKAFDMVKNGQIKTSPAIIALQWLQLNRERLKKLWQKT